ncbi:MAG: glycosyltransferase family 4 protein [Janthinobacterium lividum]
MKDVMEHVKPLSILQIVRAFDRDGGVEHVAYELQRAWRQAGIDTRVLTASVKNENDRLETDLVAPWLGRIATGGRGRYVGRLFVVPLFSIAATWRLRRAKGDRMVVSHGDSLAGDICVIHAVNKASLAEKRRVGNRLWMLNPINAWVGLRDRYMIGGLRYRSYVAISERVASELKQYYAVPDSRIAMIPNGVNIERFRADAVARQEVRAEFGIPVEAPLLLFAGHEFERKGLAYIVQALAKLDPEVRLLVVGGGTEGPYRTMADKAGIKADRLVFAGRRSDMPRLYAAADVFVFPTYYEAFGLVCMEAMAAGLPLFATKVGGIEDYLEDGVNGGFIRRDAEDIADRLRPVLADAELRQRLSRGARSTAEHYTWTKVAERYLELLRSLQDA